MGIKENFLQAARELTGSAKDTPKDSAGKTSQVEDLRRAIEADGSEKPVAPAIPPAPVPVAGGFSEKSPDFSAPYYQNPSAVPAVPAPYEQDMSVMPVAPSADPAGIEAAFPGVQAAVPMPAPSPVNPSLADPFGSTRIPSQPAPAETPQMSAQMRAAEPSPVNPYPRAAEPSPVAGYFNMGANPQGVNPLMNPTAPVTDDMMADEMTVISKNTVVEGNIRSFANMNIDGNIRGDIETTKNIELNGKVIGNLTCNNAQMLTSQIQGNIRMKGNVLMGRDTLLIGDLVSTYAKVNGKIKGNMEVGGKAELKGDAVIFGDISASTITVDDGAIIQGYVSTTFLNKEESRNIFPEAISIAE